MPRRGSERPPGQDMGAVNPTLLGLALPCRAACLQQLRAVSAGADSCAESGLKGTDAAMPATAAGAAALDSRRMAERSITWTRTGTATVSGALGARHHDP